MNFESPLLPFALKFYKPYTFYKMLEEKNDNLPEADGNPENVAQQVEQAPIEEMKTPVTASESDELTEAEEETIVGTATEVTDTAEEVVEAPTVKTIDAEVETANVVALTDEEVADDTLVIEHNDAVNSIAESNAEEGEDATRSGRHDIPMLDYESLSMEDLVAELEQLVTEEKVMSVKDHIEELKKAFVSKYNHLIEEKKDEFVAENPDSTEEFHYHLPVKSKFDTLYHQFRDKRNVHFKKLQHDLQGNLENRLAIVEELKNLINPQENIKDTLKHFNELRERWKSAGPIPKDKYNHVWNNYHFHVENFYDYLHLDREARDIDFKHNLELKQKIIARVEELVQDQDINKAFRELQDLHRIWKEEIGPVSREHREEIWNQFSALTKQMHDKREVLFEAQRGKETDNLAAKQEIVAQIEALAQEKVNSHALWQAQVEKVEALRSAFFNAGKVPADVNEATWSAFKNATRDFNVLKNSFYKDIKKDQQENLNRKNALLAQAIALQESEDFAATTPVMKQIQEEWKTIGHVPRKYSDKIWKEFKDACNHYFEKLKAQRNELNEDEVAAFDKKKEYLENLRTFELTGDHKTDLDAIKAHIETWKTFGRVPQSRRHIEGKFNKVLDVLFEKLSLSKKDTDMMRFSNRVEQLAGSEDSRKLESEKIFIIRKIEEVQQEIFQLENNIQFFTNTKNAKKENSIVLEVRKNIEKHKESLETWRDKLKQLRNMSE